jgi:hypothetical protein
MSTVFLPDQGPEPALPASRNTDAIRTKTMTKEKKTLDNFAAIR